MKINIITNIFEGYGLKRDYEILKEDLESIGHKVQGIDFRISPQATLSHFADINLFLEVIVPEFFGLAAKQYYIPNPEQWKEEYDGLLPKMDRILCKTWDARKIFDGKKGVDYLGFRAKDIGIPKVQRKYAFLHVAGKSNMKNTTAVLDCWKHYQIHIPLVIVSSAMLGTMPDNVHYVAALPDGAMIAMMNSYLFHLCPSAYEGFGHTTHEALACGNVVISIDAPPMNEYQTRRKLRVRPTRKYPVGLATASDTDPCEVYDAVMRALSLTETQLMKIQSQARFYYELKVADFRKKLKEVFP